MNIATLTMFNVQYKPFALLIPGGIQLATWQRFLILAKIPHPNAHDRKALRDLHEQV